MLRVLLYHQNPTAQLLLLHQSIALASNVMFASPVLGLLKNRVVLAKTGLVMNVTKV